MALDVEQRMAGCVGQDTMHLQLNLGVWCGQQYCRFCKVINVL
jgi:hypothetical protein